MADRLETKEWTTQTRMTPLLAYCVRSLAIRDSAARDVLVRLGLQAEIADDDHVDADFWRASGVEIATVQAWWLHAAHPLHRDRAARRHARDRIVATLDLAVRLRAPRALVVCGFGDEIADRPFERCVEFFGGIAGPARERGLRVLLEPLSPRRCSAMWRVEEIVALQDALAAPDVFELCLDTGHLMDSGVDPGVAFAALDRPVAEIQFKGRASAPPVDLPLRAWLAALPAPPPIISFEHNVPIEGGLPDALVADVRRAVEDFDTRRPA